MLKTNAFAVANPPSIFTQAPNTIIKSAPTPMEIDATCCQESLTKDANYLYCC